MKIKIMEVEEKTLPAVDTPDENNLKKGKILTLLFPAELQQGEGKEVKKDKNKPPTKVVIRRLPPKLTKEAFLEEFAPLPAHDYFYFVRGDLNLGSHAFSRAYINFLNQEDMFAFKEKFDDYDIQDDKGKTYRAVVEFAPFQKIPKRTVIKKKSKAGTLESDPKYIEFLQKLEESKNFINNPSEYFHETESSTLKTKIVMTPLLEYLKKKRQKKIDLKNEIRQRKREAEREKKRKEEEKKKLEREKRKEEKKSLDRSKNVDEKAKKVDVKDKKADDGRPKEDKSDSKSQENLKIETAEKKPLDSVIPNDPAILEVVLRHSSSEKHSRTGNKSTSVTSEETKPLKTNESDSNLGKPERKYSDFRTRLAEEKQKKTFYKRDLEEFKPMKTNQGNRKGVPDEKGDNYSIGSGSEMKDVGKKLLSDAESKRQDYRIETKETKSKFRYSEQRNRDREFRLKTSDCKITKESQGNSVGLKNKVNTSDEKGAMKKGNEEEGKILETKTKHETKTSSKTDQMTLPGRRKSLEMEREVVNTERKRSKSFHDISSKELCRLQEENKNEKYRSEKDRDSNTPENDCGQNDDNSKESTESERMTEESKKDRKAERRIRNKRMHPCDYHPTYLKDRPSLEIYRPGMGKFSKQRLEQKRDDRSNSTSTSYANKVGSFVNKSNKKPGMKSDIGENKSSSKNEGNEMSGKAQNEVRTMTFTRSTSKEN